MLSRENREGFSVLSNSGLVLTKNVKVLTVKELRWDRT